MKILQTTMFLIGIILFHGCFTSNDENEEKENIVNHLLAAGLYFSANSPENIYRCSSIPFCPTGRSPYRFGNYIDSMEVYKNGNLIFIESNNHYFLKACNYIDSDPDSVNEYYYGFNANSLNIAGIKLKTAESAYCHVVLEYKIGEWHTFEEYSEGDFIDGDIFNFTRIIAGEYRFVPVRP